MLRENADKARALVKAVTPLLSGRSENCHLGCHTALDHAIITVPMARDPNVVAELEPIVARVLGL